ncbi:helix-turn-helix domain-containing protein [Actinomadura sp. GC306]|uniref:AfsR/SARP family transcriptional regulator n=1 Tax=Actinomadura sp. GC306 TaxID=2530367 RepID=UPI001044B4C1|nr:BTAD domain-containing putative transcriptional regulator [Actinomadura sp. GC306]TDC62952.1 helix-turn-helix domain-containing protein [Actinomadura sp. GC306]
MIGTTKGVSMADPADDLPTGDSDGPEFLVLGELVVRSRGRLVPLPGPSVRALLSALLLTPGDVVGEDRLLTLAWGADRGSRRALQCAATRLRTWLRTAVGPDALLEHAGSGYRLAVPAGSVDIARFRARVAAHARTDDPERSIALLAGALREWRGPVLGGHPEPVAADPAVREVEQARIDCAGALADLALRLGRPGTALALVEDAAAGAPYDEPLQARLIRLLTACGRNAAALRQVERVRRRLADELGVPPSREVLEAHAAALDGHGEPVPVPHQLPAAICDFAGRRDELAVLCAPLLSGGDRSGPLLLVVYGTAGVGKTALAVQAAHRAAPRFEHGQLYAVLRGPGSRPADPAEVLAAFLRALGVDDGRIPRSLHERASLFRSRAAGRRLLLLLDDAMDDAQLHPLIPGTPGCAVLVTARAPLAGPAGARTLRLDALPAADALTLLGRAAGRDAVTADPAAAEIVRMCGRLPLAVRVAGLRLARRPGASPARLAERLRPEHRRMDELAVRGIAVRPRLRENYRDLAPAHRRAFRLLGLLRTATFPEWAASAALGTGPDAARAHLEALADAALLDPLGEDAAGQVRYGLPALLALFARELALAAERPGTREAALRSAYGGWLHRAELAAREPAASWAAAWFEAEDEALATVAEQAAAQGFHDLGERLAKAVREHRARRRIGAAHRVRAD